MVHMKAPLSQQIQPLAQRLVLQLSVVLKTLKLHEVHNKALLIGIENLKETINTLWALNEGEIQIVFVEGVVFVNNIRVRVSAHLEEQVNSLQIEFEKRELGGLAFLRPVDSEALKDFLRIMSQPADNPDAVASQKYTLKRLANAAIELYDPKFFSENREFDRSSIHFRFYAVHTYAKAIVLVKDYFCTLKETEQRYHRCPLTRIVQDLVDIAAQDVDLLIQTTSIKDLYDYSYNHAVNTAVLSILMGRELGLSRIQLADLGMAAILANIGFFMLPESFLNNPNKLSEAELVELRRFVTSKTYETISKTSLSDAILLRLLVAQELNVPYGKTSQSPKVPHVFSRIVRVANVFDALTTRRPWREGYTPDEALQILVKDAKKIYDPFMVKTLINALGLYPLGCEVRLGSGELATIYHNTNIPGQYTQPWVKVVTNRHGQSLHRTIIRNLAEYSGPEGQVTDVYLFGSR